MPGERTPGHIAVPSASVRKCHLSLDPPWLPQDVPFPGAQKTLCRACSRRRDCRSRSHVVAHESASCELGGHRGVGNRWNRADQLRIARGRRTRHSHPTSDPRHRPRGDHGAVGAENQGAPGCRRGGTRARSRALGGAIPPGRSIATFECDPHASARAITPEPQQRSRQPLYSGSASPSHFSSGHGTTPASTVTTAPTTSTSLVPVGVRTASPTPGCMYISTTTRR